MEIGNNIFTIFVRRMNNVYDAHRDKLDLYIKERRTFGFSNREIYDDLMNQITNRSGLYEELHGAFNKEINTSLLLDFQVESNNLEGNVMWQLDPVAEHCDSCLYQSSRGALPIMEFPVPGFQESHGSNCDQFCKCTLIPARNINAD